MEEIVDMARGPEDYAPIEAADNPYPCGLRITLGEAELRKLGIEEIPPLGSKCAFYVCGEVVSTSESSEYGGSKCMGVQIQCMSIEELPDEEEAEEAAAEKAGFKEAASKLYKNQNA